MKIDRVRIAGTDKDRRIKLTDAQRFEIRERHDMHGDSIYKLANEYGVSRRTIEFIIYPERLERCREQYKERRKDGRYALNPEKRRAAVRYHKEYKRKLLNI